MVHRRDNVDFGDKPASAITEISLGKFFAGACKFAAAAEFLCDKRYADDIADSVRSMMSDRSDGKKKFLAIRGDLINACKKFYFAINW